jgi:hypothetical protein
MIFITLLARASETGFMSGRKSAAAVVLVKIP